MPEARRKAALDVHYDSERQLAVGAAVVFADWTDAQPKTVALHRHAGLEPYESGAFYRRELPVLLPLVAQLEAQFELALLVIDGHVDLGPDRPGLGRHLFDSLGRKLRIVGVAKNEFRGAPSRPVLRGTSAKPLWVSATSDLEQAVGPFVPCTVSTACRRC